MGFEKVLVFGVLFSVALAGCIGPNGPAPNPEAQSNPAGFFCSVVEKRASPEDGVYLVASVVGESKTLTEFEVLLGKAAVSEREPLFKALFGSESKERFELLCGSRGGIKTGKTRVEYLGAKKMGAGESDCFMLKYPAVGMVPASQEKVCFDRLGFYLSYSEAEQAGKKIVQEVERQA